MDQPLVGRQIEDRDWVSLADLYRHLGMGSDSFLFTYHALLAQAEFRNNDGSKYEQRFSAAIVPAIYDGSLLIHKFTAENIIALSKAGIYKINLVGRGHGHISHCCALEETERIKGAVCFEVRPRWFLNLVVDLQ